jgi:hypothetical protein
MKYDLKDFAGSDTGRGVCYLWPTDPRETVYPELLFQPLLDIATAHPLLVPPKDVRYSGFPTPRSTGLSPWDLLSGRYNRGEPLVRVLLGISFALGHEQGRRHELDELRDALKELVRHSRKTNSMRVTADLVARHLEGK